MQFCGKYRSEKASQSCLVLKHFYSEPVKQTQSNPYIDKRPWDKKRIRTGSKKQTTERFGEMKS